ncbi:MAG TPA: hypothetical protein DCY89_03800 [Gammaproteobacteria bacterium]|nr:hypothetical protein [Gammaproteobacteria bacterium]
MTLPRRAVVRLAVRLVGGIFAAAPVFAASQLDEALRLLEQGEGLRALSELRPLAEGGNAEAQFRMGTIFERGIGIVPDDYWAWYWYQLAAAQGHTPAVEALYALGARTAGTPEGAADEAVDQAANVAATPQETATPVGPTEEAPAEPVLPSAADAPVAADPQPMPVTPAGSVETAVTATPAEGTGEVRAPGPKELAALAKARERGISVSFDPDLPLPLPRGDDITGQPTGDGPGGGPRAAPLQVAAAPAPMSADPFGGSAGTAEAAAPPAAAAAATDPGTAAAADPATLAYPALAQLAAAGDVAAQRELAARLHAGRGRPRDVRSAMDWYRRAAEAGDAESQFQLGNLYLMGEGIEADDVWAITWFRRAAGQGHAKAQAHLDNLLKISEGAR